MADQDAQDRNLPASAKKIARSRAEGQVPRSRDLPHFAMMVAGGAVLAVGGPLIVERLRLMLASACISTPACSRGPASWASASST